MSHYKIVMIYCVDYGMLIVLFFNLQMPNVLLGVVLMMQPCSLI